MTNVGTYQIEAKVQAATTRFRQLFHTRTAESLLFIGDPLLNSSLSELVAEHGLVASPLPVAYEDLPREARPFTVWIESEQKFERFISATLRLAVTEALASQRRPIAARSACAWIPLHREQLASARIALSSKALCRPAGAATKLLRFWDPRVFEQLRRIAPQDHHWSWFPEETEWLWIDADGAPKQAGLSALARTTAPLAWQLEPSQWAALARVESLNVGLQRLGITQELERRFAAVQLERLLAMAESLRLPDGEDRILYAILSYELGGPLDGHPALAAAFEAAAHGESLSDRFACIAEPVWEQIRRDLSPSATLSGALQ